MLLAPILSHSAAQEFTFNHQSTNSLSHVLLSWYRAAANQEIIIELLKNSLFLENPKVYHCCHRCHNTVTCQTLRLCFQMEWELTSTRFFHVKIYTLPILSKLPEGLLLKNHMVACVMPDNIALCRLTDALMHNMKKHVTLHMISTTIEIIKPEYTNIQVSVLGSEPNWVTFLVLLLAKLSLWDAEVSFITGSVIL